jgi:hypothetical protein
MTSVISANGCCGFVLKRRHQHEAFDSSCKSLGLFDSEQDAVDAILKAPPPAISEPLPSLEGESA